MIRSKDFWILSASSLLLICLGLVTIWHVTTMTHNTTYIEWQIKHICIGALFSLAAFLMEKKGYFENFRWIVFCFGLALIISPLVVHSDYHRFIHMFDMTFYPGPLGLLCCIPYITNCSSMIERPLDKTTNFISLLIIIFTLNALFIAQPDLKLACLADFIVVILLLPNIKKNFIPVMLFYALMIFLVYTALPDYIIGRTIMNYHYVSDPNGSGYQTMNALDTIKSGGVFGAGFYSPIKHHINHIINLSQCFILQYTGYELGIVGLVFVILLFGLMAYTGLNLLKRIQNSQKKNIAIGMFLFIFTQALIGIGRVFNVSPGLGPYPIPFMSFNYGFEISIYMAMGIFFSICMGH